MAGIAVIGDITTGHAGFPPSPMIKSPIKKTYFNGKKPGVVDKQCQFMTHQLIPLPIYHTNLERYPVEGSSKTKIEGYYVARIGDKLADGDVIAKGSENSFVE